MGGNHQGRRNQVERVAWPRKAAGFSDKIMLKIKDLERIRLDLDAGAAGPPQPPKKRVRLAAQGLSSGPSPASISAG
jgi:hypothetical protein